MVTWNAETCCRSGGVAGSFTVSKWELIVALRAFSLATMHSHTSLSREVEVLPSDEGGGDGKLRSRIG